MRLLTLAAALGAALLLAVLPLRAEGPAQSAAAERLVAELGLGRPFRQLGETIAGSPRRGAATADERFLREWEAASREAFDAVDIDRVLVLALTAGLIEGDVEAIEIFVGSPLWARIIALQTSASAMPLEAQIAALAKGQALLLRASPGRRSQIEEMLRLGQAEAMIAMLAESLRGLALGLHLSKYGDIEVPWEEIDAHVETTLGDMESALLEAGLGSLASTFESLDDEEIEAYLDYLRAPATQRLQTLTTTALGFALHDAMRAIGAKVAARLSAVAI